jgi:hypothetical protein
MGKFECNDIEVELLRFFVKHILRSKTTIEIWNLPDPDECKLLRFWRRYRSLRHNMDKDSPLVIHNFLPGHLEHMRCVEYSHLSIWMHPSWSQLEPARVSAGGHTLTKAMGIHIHDKLYPGHRIKRLAVWGLLGCSCLCNASVCPDQDARGIIGEISAHFRKHSRTYKYDPAWARARSDLLKAFLAEGRLEICPTPCAAYDGWISRDSESNATVSVLDLLTWLPDVRKDC